MTTSRKLWLASVVASSVGSVLSSASIVTDPTKSNGVKAVTAGLSILTVSVSAVRIVKLLEA